MKKKKKKKKKRFLQISRGDVKNYWTDDSFVRTCVNALLILNPKFIWQWKQKNNIVAPLPGIITPFG